MRYEPKPYQTRGEAWALEKPYIGLFFGMGTGKTVVTATALDRLRFDRLEAERILVIAPKKVAEHVWRTEVAKWDHTKHMRVVEIKGDQKQRLQALQTPGDIYTIGRDLVTWLVDTLKGSRWNFDTLVIDELSSFKNPRSKRFRSLRKIRPKIKRLIGLTGTPTPKSLLDLWPQIYLMDRGERLEKFLGQYRTRYFDVASMNGPIVTGYAPKPGAREKIYAKISDICLHMSAEDNLQLPPRRDIIWEVELPPKALKAYNELERELYTQINWDVITAANNAVAVGKLLQMTGGAIYTAKPEYLEIHTEKLDALEELVEAAQGDPVLIFYWFDHERDRIMKRLKPYGIQQLKKPDQIDAWNRGEIPVMLLHPSSGGHGLNLQYGGHIGIWFASIYDLEVYQQACARIDRQGQTKPVMMYHLMVPGTVDIAAQCSKESKDTEQRALLNALKGIKARIA